MSNVRKLLTGAFGEDFVRFVLNAPDSGDINSIPENAPAEVINLLVSIALDSAQNAFADVNFLLPPDWPPT